MASIHRIPLSQTEGPAAVSHSSLRRKNRKLGIAIHCVDLAEQCVDQLDVANLDGNVERCVSILQQLEIR